MKMTIFILMPIVLTSIVYADLDIGRRDGELPVINFGSKNDYAYLSADNNWTGVNTFQNITVVNYTYLNVTGGVDAEELCIGGECFTNWTNTSYWTKTGDDIYYDDGNVGIKTSSPQGELQIKGTEGIWYTPTNIGDNEFLTITSTNEDSRRVNWTYDPVTLKMKTRYYTGGEVLTLDYGTQRVGIGTDSPSYKLSVSENTDTVSVLGRTAVGFVTGLSDYAYIGHVDQQDATGYGFVQNNAGATYLNSEAGQDLSFGVGGNRKAVIDSNGYLGIGDLTPDAPLDVESSSSWLATFIRPSAGPSIKLGQSDSIYGAWGWQAANGLLQLGTYNDLGVFNIKASNNYVGIGTTDPSGELEVESSTTDVYNTVLENTQAVRGHGLNIKVAGSGGGTYALNVTTDFDGTPNPALMVNGLGDVGIGTTSPDSLTHIKSTSDDARLKLETTDASSNAGIQIYNPAGRNGEFQFWNNDVGEFSFGANENIFFIQEGPSASWTTIFQVDASGNQVEYRDSSAEMTVTNTATSGNPQMIVNQEGAANRAKRLSFAYQDNLRAFVESVGTSTGDLAFTTYNGAGYNQGLYIETDADVRLPTDSKRLQFGSSQDAYLTYNGSDFVCNPDSVGSGVFIVDGNLKTTDRLTANDADILQTDSNTGYGLYVHRNLAPADTNQALVYIHNDHASDDQAALKVRSDNAQPAIYVTVGDVHIDGDNDKLIVGEGADASIYYDGSDMYINPKEVGSGDLNVEGNLNVNGNVNVTGCICYDGGATCLGSCV